MKTAQTKLYNRIEIKGGFDTYEIEQGVIEERPDYFVITSVGGYSNIDAGGHRSLLAAIQHVNNLIRNDEASYNTVPSDDINRYL